MFDLNARLDRNNQEYTNLLEYVKGSILGYPELTENHTDMMLEKAIYTFLERTNLSSITPVHWNVLSRLTEYYLNVHGLVGIESEKLGDVSTQYTEDIPKDIVASMIRYRILP